MLYLPTFIYGEGKLYVKNLYNIRQINIKYKKRTLYKDEVLAQKNMIILCTVCCFSGCKKYLLCLVEFFLNLSVRNSVSLFDKLNLFGEFYELVNYFLTTWQFMRKGLFYLNTNHELKPCIYKFFIFSLSYNFFFIEAPHNSVNFHSIYDVIIFTIPSKIWKKE